MKIIESNSAEYLELPLQIQISFEKVYSFYNKYTKDNKRIWVTDVFILNPGFNSNTWNTSIGRGIFANAAAMLTLQMSIFASDDGARYSFG